VSDAAPLLVAWERLTTALMTDTRRFTASFRPNLTHYINQHLLDGLVLLSSLEFQPAVDRLARLRRLDEHLAALKVLVRQAHAQEAMSHAQYDRHQSALAEAGRMLGGWRRHLEGRG